MPAPVPPGELRARFASAMSDMYRREVPLYGRLLALVEEVNAGANTSDFDVTRIGGERHGAIRLGTAAELGLMARAFAVLGMVPVGYYDLAPVGLPVHSTAFRPITAAGLATSPFRIFTSLLRIDLIEPASLRRDAEAALARRQIVTPAALALIERAEASGGLDEVEGALFVTELLETFRWHDEASIEAPLYDALSDSHRLVADVVSFRGPHINHLTPRVLDIDLAQHRMAEQGFDPKAAIEGPPRRACPVLLRQTSFKALQEPIRFPGGAGGYVEGRHSARFGEIEQRGAALTPLGRARYDRWISEGGDLAEALPDDWGSLRRHGLAYFRFTPSGAGNPSATATLEDLIAEGAMIAQPILYEDFLPASAAGIFRSNLGDDGDDALASRGERQRLEEALGRPVLDEFALYAAEQSASLLDALQGLGRIT